MRKLESLGPVDRHQANCVFVLIRPQRYDAIRLAKIAEVVDELFKVSGLVDPLLLPILHKMQGCLQDRRRRVEDKFPDHNVECNSSFGVATLDAFTHSPHPRYDLCAAVDAVERGEQRHYLGLAIVARDGTQLLPQLLRVDSKTRQARHAHQADVISAGNDHVQARKQITGLRSIRDIHALDHKWNPGLR